MSIDRELAEGLRKLGKHKTPTIAVEVVSVDKAGIHLQRGEVDFKSLLNELLNELKKAIIQTPAGVGNFAPNNVAKFDEINNKINELLQ